jgi:hypothetical protein
VLIGVGFWLVAPVPVALIGSPYDAGLFVRLANAILAGDWLGRFDALTLAKGPFYPLLLAGCAAAHLPVQAGIEAVYLTGAVLMARVVARLSGRAWAGALCLALLVFNPACTDWSVGALMREPLYCALTLLVMALAARVFLCCGGVWWGVGLGAAWAAFWLTREEGVLLAPSVAVLAAWYFRGLFRRLRGGTTVVVPLRPAVAAVMIGLVLILSVCGINQHYYGVFRSNDFQAGAFPRAYGALARIVPDKWQRLTPISRDMRARAYAVSEAARELQPFLEGDSAHFTADVRCEETGQPVCHDIPGASFMWALRDAVARAGYYDNARRADGYYKRLAREIDAACNAGALRCLPPRDGLMPPLDVRDASPVLSSLAHVAWDMLLLGRAGPLVMPSTAEGAEASAYAAVTRGSAISPQARVSRQANGDLRWPVMRAAAWVMETGSVVATPAALIWLGVFAARGFRLTEGWVLAIALLLAVILRLGLLALLDATSIERQFRYESPAVALLIVFAITAGIQRIEKAGGAVPAPPDPPSSV